MKRIVKTHAPAEFDRWFTAQPSNAEGNKIDCSFDDIPGDVRGPFGDVRGALKDRLLEDQGWLCCYTGIRVTETSSHIEHIKPQALCVDQEDINYNNLLAAYPRTPSAECRFGAHQKGNWYDARLFIQPLAPDCESRFYYNLNGEIHPAITGDSAAIETIQRLRLDDSSLTELRYQAIQELLFPDNHEISEVQAKRLLQELDNRDRNRRFRSFCFVLKMACEKYLLRIHQQRNRNQAVRRARRP